MQIDAQLHRATSDTLSLISLKIVSLDHMTNPIWEAWENYFIFHVMRERIYVYSHFPTCCGCLFPLDALNILCPGLMGRCLSITWRVTLGKLCSQQTSQVPTQVLSKNPDDPSWNSSMCFGEAVHRSYWKQLYGQEENKWCTAAHTCTAAETQ